MANKKETGTIYQQLNNFFNLSGFGMAPIQKQSDGTKIIIRGNSPDEIKRKALEIEQQRKLQDKFFKTTDRGFQKAMQFEASRLQLYTDLEGFEYVPLIASALDLFMEEATTIGDDGKMLKIYSNKERIKYLLEEFFYDVVNVNVNLPFWTRNLPIKHDSKIPLLNGTELTIKEISEKLKNDPTEEIWTYSIQDKTKKILPGKIIWCDLTRKNTEIVRVHLDDNTFVETTPDHEFLLRNGLYKKACELNAGESLMPFYTIESKLEKKLSGYEKVYNPSSNEYIFTHKLTSQELLRDVEHEKTIDNKIVTHHNDFNLILNHKVLSVEFLNNKHDVYCMEVVGKHNEQDRHNFPICSKDINGNYSRNGIFVSNCKYGDNFTLLYGERKKGITHVKQLVNYEIERFERIQNGKPVVKFRERMTGDEFNIFEIAHFRLLGDDKLIPYGSSILNKVRRSVRQLILCEDAMLTYRLMRAGEKKVFKIDVGNIDEDDIEDYIYKVATKFKKTPQINHNDGQIDYRFNILGNDEDYFLPVRNANTQTGIDTLPGACLALDTKIELLDGRSLMLSEIIKEFEDGKELWSYSINPETGEIVPGKITWAGVTRKNTDVIKITLDNGEIITCTPDHKFPTKFNGIKEAKDLKTNESLWSFNKKFEGLKSGYGTEYESIYDHSINDWRFTHRLVHDYFNGECKKGFVRHHIDFNRYNNSPNNLIKMSVTEHFKLHGKNSIIGGLKYKELFETNEEFNKNVNDILKKGRMVYHNKLKNDEIFKKNVREKQSNSRKEYLNSLNDEDRKKAFEHLWTEENRKKCVISYKRNPNRKEILEKARKKSIITKNKSENKLKYSNNSKKLWMSEEFKNSVIEPQRIKYSDKLISLLIEYYSKHLRLSIILDEEVNIENSEWLKEFWSLNQNNQQLKKLSKITANNIDKLLKTYGYLNWRDFTKKIPCYNHKIVSIQILTEKQDTGTITIDGNEKHHNFHNFALSCGVFTQNSNLNEIADIEFIRDQIFIGLGIPKPFLSMQDASGGGKNMAQFDIRFAKKVNRIQQAMIQELNKMAMVHLYLMGYDKEDISNFTLALTNPSTQSELVKAELLREKAQTYTELTRGENGIAAMSHTKAKRILFNMSDKEIVDDLKQQKMEKVVQQELADAPVVIKKSGIYHDIDKKYGEDGAENMIPQNTGGQGDDQGGGMGGPIEGGQEPIAGLPNQSPADLPPVQAENIKNKYNLLEDKFLDNVNKLVYGDEYKIKEEKQKQLIKENENIIDQQNQLAENTISEIDKILTEGDSINTNFDTVDDDENVEDFNDFDLNIDEIETIDDK
jgi:hypothetical protein